MQTAITAGLAPTAEQLTEFQARCELETRADSPRSLRIAADVAEIRVEGVLTPKPNFFAMLFGGGNTSYADIQAALAVADSDPSVKRAHLHVASPGGTVDQLFETLAAIQAFSKPIDVSASCACSAAYAIAAVAGPIHATSPAAQFGSVGVLVTLTKKEGVYNITSTEAPDKRPDPSTEAGRATIREQLDAVHELFVDAIATGRGTDTDTVNANFGRGAEVLAKQAKQLGMIDSLPKKARAKLRAETSEAPTAKSEPEQIQSAATGGAPTKAIPMTAEELKAQHPELYLAVTNTGRDAERNRVAAHLTLGQASGDMKTALASIEAGDEMTALVQAKHMAASMNRKSVEERQEESEETESALSGIAPGEESAEGDIGDQVVALMQQSRGK